MTPQPLSRIFCTVACANRQCYSHVANAAQHPTAHSRFQPLRSLRCGYKPIKESK